MAFLGSTLAAVLLAFKGYMGRYLAAAANLQWSQARSTMTACSKVLPYQDHLCRECHRKLQVDTESYVSTYAQ